MLSFLGFKIHNNRIKFTICDLMLSELLGFAFACMIWALIEMIK